MVVLVALIVLVLALPYAYPLLHKGSTINVTDFNKAAAMLAQAKTDSARTLPADGLSGKLFYFNPNGLPAEKWKQLGLNDHQISIIKNYEAKGSHFYKNTDLQKIYGISPADYARLEPYIDIPQPGAYITIKLKTGLTVEINTADSAKLTEVRGIGPSFAMRIIRYRERLGGFYHLEQIKEVFGVDSAKYAGIAPQLTIDPSAVVKLSINSISFASLREFPYLNYKQANAVIQYRAQHGKYTSVNDMRNIAILTPQDIQKIEPYLNFK